MNDCEMRERRLFQHEVAEADKGSLNERKESCREFYDALRSDPHTVVNRIERLYEVVNRETRAAEQKRIRVTPGLLTELRADRAYVGRRMNARDRRRPRTRRSHRGGR